MGGKELIAVDISRAGGSEFTISSATYQVRNTKHQILESGDANVEGTRAHMLFDTTKQVENNDLYTAGEKYMVYFYCQISNRQEVIVGPVYVTIMR